MTDLVPNFAANIQAKPKAIDVSQAKANDASLNNKADADQYKKGDASSYRKGEASSYKKADASENNKDNAASESAKGGEERASFKEVIAETAQEKSIDQQQSTDKQTVTDQQVNSESNTPPGDGMVPESAVLLPQVASVQQLQPAIEALQEQNGGANLDQGAVTLPGNLATVTGENLPLGGNELPLSALPLSEQPVVNPGLVRQQATAGLSASNTTGDSGLSVGLNQSAKQPAGAPYAATLSTSQANELGVQIKSTVQLTTQSTAYQQLIGASSQNIETQLPPVSDISTTAAIDKSVLPPANSAAFLTGRPAEGLLSQTGITSASLQVETPLGQPGWGAEVSSRVRWLVQNNINTAEIRINPPDLGPLEIQIKSEGEKTSILFVAQQSATRETLEQALPRLREILESGGLQLADAQVSDQGLHNQRQSGDRELSIADQQGEVEGAGEQPPLQQESAINGDGLIDFYI